MQYLKKIPFFLLLLALFFCLHGSVENYGFLHAGEVLNVGLVIIFCMAVLLMLLWLFTRDLIFSSLTCFFIAGWYLFFGAVYDWVESKAFLSFMKSYTVLVPLLIACTIAWIVFLKRNRQWHGKLVFYFNLLLLLYCLYDGYLLLRQFNRASNAPPVLAVTFDSSRVLEKPNVYFLVFDEYAGYQSLKDSFGFKNDSLYAFMEQKGFKILPTFSNYEYTPFSISSIVNMQYVDSSYDHRLLTQKDIQQRFGEIRNGQVFSIFREMDYEIKNYSIFDLKERPALSGSNPLFPIHHYLLTEKIFHNRVVKDLGWLLVTGKWQVPLIKEKYLYRDDKYNSKVAEKVIKSTTVKSDRPQFCYGHFFLPHGPYFRDSTGKYIEPGLMQDLFNKPLYLSYLKYTNTVIRSLVNNIVANDPGALVIVMSDHGFYNYQSHGDDDPLNYDNFCLVRFPRNNYLPYKEKWSTVNLFRYVFNCGFGQSMPYLKDSTIFVNE